MVHIRAVRKLLGRQGFGVVGFLRGKKKVGGSSPWKILSYRSMESRRA